MTDKSGAKEESSITVRNTVDTTVYLLHETYFLKISPKNAEYGTLNSICQ
jgi:hypothetical protein